VVEEETCRGSTATTRTDAGDQRREGKKQQEQGRVMFTAG